MAVYTEVSDQELEAFLADYDIGSAEAFKGIGKRAREYLLERAVRGVAACDPKHLRRRSDPYYQVSEVLVLGHKAQSVLRDVIPDPNIVGFVHL